MSDNHATKPSSGEAPRESWRDAESFNQAERYGAAKADVDRPARFPLWRLMLAGICMIGATFALRLAGVNGWVAAIIGMVGFVAVLLLTGGRAKAAPKRAIAPARGIDGASVAAALEKAEAELAAIDKAAATLDYEIRGELADMTARARRVLDTIAADPLDLDRSRKFLVAYLPSARRAVEKYVALGVRDAELERRFRALVAEMSETCRRQEQSLSEDDRFDLEVEMETLADRLRLEQ